MAAEIGPALGLTADSKGLSVATEELRDITKAAGVAEKAADGFSGSGRRMSQSMSQAIAVLRSMDGSLTKLAQSQRGNNNETDEAARKAAALRAQYTQLRSALDPLYANSKRYETSLETLNAAQSAGIISAAEYQRSLAMLGTQYAALSTNSVTLGQNTSSVGNVFAQFNDIGMMAFAGQSPLMLAIQQGTQLNQVWGQLGGSTKAIGGVMKQAFMQLLNPINLVTLAAIAGGAALVQWAMSLDFAGAKTKSLEDSMDGLRDSMSQIADAQDILSKSNLELYAEFGTYAATVKQAAMDLVAAQKLTAEMEFNNALKAASKDMADLGINIDGLRAKYDDLKRTTDVAGREFARDAFIAAQQETERLAEKLTISEDAAAKLAQQFYNLRTATNLEGRGAAVAEINRILERAGVSAAVLPEEMAKALAAAASVNFELAKTGGVLGGATGATGAWASQMASVLGLVRGIAAGLSAISGRGIEAAAVQSEIDALRAGRTLQQAAHTGRLRQIELEGKARIGALTREKGLVGTIQGIAELAANRGVLAKQEELSILQEQVREREREANKSSTKGAAELKSAQKGFQSLRELMEEESIFQFAEYEKRQGQLDTALQKRLVSEQSYQEMSDQLRVRYFASEWEQQALSYQLDQEALQLALDQKLITEEEYYQKRKELQWANLLSEQNRSDLSQDLSNTSQYFGQLYSMTGSSLDGLLKLQQGFAAASALMNAWVGYTTVLADPTVSFWMKLAAAGKVLAAGLGAVQAIKGGSKAGGGGAAGAGGGGSASAAPETPLRVSVDAFDPNQLYTGEAVQKLFASLQKEAGNRGIIWVPTN